MRDDTPKLPLPMPSIRPASRFEASLWNGTQRLAALLLLIALLPLLAVLYVVVVATSGRPFLYSQARPGQSGRSIRVLKIRTMRNGSDRDSSLAIAVPRGSSQVTTVGRYLRELKIDEFPQLWNVVRGDMLLVGPRPIAWALHDRLVASIPGFSDRLGQKPGVTSLSQVCITDNSGEERLIEDWSRRLEADRHMIRHHSARYDLIVLGITLFFLLRKVSRVVGKLTRPGRTKEEATAAPTRAHSAARAAGLALSTLALAGCASSPNLANFRTEGDVLVRTIGSPQPSETVVSVHETQASRPNNTDLAADEESAVSGEGYRIGPGDVLSVNINGEEGMTDLRVPVDLAGSIQLPWIHPIQATTKTTADLQSELVQAYKSLFHRPWVVVTVRDYRSQPLFLLGSFQAPGVVYLERPTTLLEAIARGEGLLDSAYLAGARILRDGQPAAIDLRQLLRGGNLSLDQRVLSGDTIYVPDERDLEAYVLGAVPSSGAVRFRGGELDILSALADAGGVEEILAELGEVRIIRSISETEAQMILVDVSRILLGEAITVPLVPGDIVYVPRSSSEQWNDVVSTIEPTISLLSSTVRPLSFFGLGEANRGGGGGKSKSEEDD